MAEKIYIDLEIGANTAKAKRQIQDLQTSLNKAISSGVSRQDLGVGKNIQQATQQAIQLKAAIESATNVNTGKLNLTSFQASLQRSNLNLKTLAISMRQLGPEGVQAFSQLTNAIVSADTRIFSLSKSARSLINTFANTAKYQISSMGFQMITSSITETISYIKDLDKSLTNIQIVTSLNEAEMEQFAKSANKAAKALSATTQEYADAALIYFQQGLSMGEVTQRANTTIRLAHATGASAQEVSEWMTAIWNNFDDGSHSLEYYGDVLAKLGAITASSADEIAGGLEKFAAVAETVGLSYEYAAAALATITAETRQSEEVVGTALKTIFSRMEGLSLGETLDDGTTLNKYSLALQAVGVNIKDTNGELKDMDTILDETALRWQTLSKDQQIALAQTVAGVRQYNQFIALMDNYDIMQNNIKEAKNSSKTLYEQQLEYENSIAGKQAKSQAAAEKLKSAFMDDEDIKKFYDTLTKVFEVLAKVVDRLGGLKGVVLTVSSVLTKLYQPQISNFFQKLSIGITTFGVNSINSLRKVANVFRKTKKEMLKTPAEQMQQEAIQLSGNLEKSMGGGDASISTTNSITQAKLDLINLDDKLTQEQKNQMQMAIEIAEAQRDQIREKEKAINGLKEQLDIEQSILDTKNKQTQLDFEKEFSKRSDKELKEFVSPPKEEGKQNAGIQLFAEHRLANLDTSVIRETGAKVGAVQGSMSNTVSMASSLRMQGQEKIGEEDKQKINSMLTEMEKKAKDAGDVFDKALIANIENFKKSGIEDINEVILKLREFQKAVDEAAKQKLENVTFEALEDQKDNVKSGTKVLDTELNSAINPKVSFTTSGQNTTDEKIDKVVTAAEKATTGSNSKVAQEIKKETAELRKAQKIRKEYNDRLKQGAVLTDKEEKELKAANKTIGKSQAQIKKLSKELKKENGILEDGTDLIDENTEAYEEFNKAVKEASEEQTGIAESAAEAAAEEEQLQFQADGVKNSVDGLGQGLLKTKGGMQGIANTFSSVFNGAMQVASGFNIAKNGFAELSKAASDGSSSFSEFLDSALQIGPGLIQMVGPFVKIIGLIVSKMIASRAAAKSSEKDADIEAKAEGKKKASVISTAMAKIGQWMASGPWGWVIAGIGIAALAALGIHVAVQAVKQGQEQADEEAKAEQAEKDSEKSAAYSAVGEAAGSMNEAAQSFQELENKGESTKEAMEAIKSSADELNTSMLELKGTMSDEEWSAMGLEGITNELNALVEDLEAGRISIQEFQERSEELQDKANLGAVTSALSAYRNSGWTEETRAAYTDSVGTYMTNNEEAMASAVDEFASKFSTDMSYDEAVMAWANAVTHSMGVGDVQNADTAEQMYLKAPPPTKWDRAIQLLASGERGGKLYNSLNGNQTKIAEAQEFFLQDDNYLYMNSINVGEGNWEGQIEEAKKNERIASATKEAVDKVGISEEAFDSYSQYIMDNTEALEDNEAATKAYTSSVLKASKALAGMVDNQDELLEKLYEGPSSFAYHEAIGETQNYLSDIVGFELSSDAMKTLAENGQLPNIIKGTKEGLSELFAVADSDMVKQGLKNLESTSEELEKLKEEGAISEEDYNNWQKFLDPTTFKTQFDLIQQDLQDGHIDNLAQYQEFLKFLVQSGIKSHDEIVNYFARNDIVLEIDVKTGEVIDTTELEADTYIDHTLKQMESFREENKGEERKEKKLEDEVERYENITSAIEAQERALDKVSKAKDRAYGANRIALMDQEIKSTEKLLELEKEKLRQMEENYKLDYSYAKGLGLEINEDGTILNAEEVRTALVEKYNSGAISEEEYSESVERLDRFIETNSEYFDQLANIEDKTYELKDLALEKITYKVEFELELDDAEMEYLDYMFENLDDDIYGIAESFDIIGQKVENTFSKIETTTNGIKDILSLAGASEEQIAAFMAGDASALEGLNLEEADIQQLMTWRSDLLSYNQELIDYKNQIGEQFTEALGKASEAMEKSSNKLEHYNSVLTTYKDIIELAGKKTLGFTNDMMQSLSDVTMQNAINQTKVAKATYEMNKEAAESAKQLYEQGAITEEAYLEAIENERTAYEDMLSIVNDGVQLATDNFVSAMERVAESFSEAMGGMAGSLEDLQRQFEQQEDLSSLYVEDYTKIYNLSKLTRNINKSINATDNVRAKGKLRKLEEEILAIQENGKEMSQYELDNLQKKYDLRLAEIALEEAQNAKNQVRMQRDSEGNWNYVYTADTSAIDQAQQKYEDSLYNIQNSNAAYIKEMQNNVVSTEQEMYDALASLAEETDLTDEEFEKRKKEIQNYYLTKMNYYTDQLKIALENNNYLYNTDWQNYNTATGYKISADEDFIDSFEETTYAQLTGFNSLEQAYEIFAQNTEIALSDATTNFKKYQNNVKIVFNSAEMDVEEFSESFQKKMDEIQDSSDEAAEGAEEMKDDMIDAFDQIEGNIEAFNESYGSEIDSMVQKNEDLVTSIQTVIDKYKELQNTSSSTNVKVPNTTSTGITGITGGTGDTVYSYKGQTGSGTFTLYSGSGYAGRQDSADPGKQTIDLDATNEDGTFQNNIFRAEKLTGNFDDNKKTNETIYRVEMQDGRTGYVPAEEFEATGNVGYTNLTGDHREYSKFDLAGVPIINFNSGTDTACDIATGSIPTYYVSGDQIIKRPFTGGNTLAIDSGYYGIAEVLKDTAGNTYISLTTLKQDSHGNYYKGSIVRRGDPAGTAYVKLSDLNGGYQTYEGIAHFDIEYMSSMGLFSNWPDIDKISSLDTGGYTGQWDSSGRIAMLHQKEIVLNAHDTENFLSAINILRDIVAIIDLQAIQQSSALSGLASIGNIANTNSNFEQNVTIHAEFPNAQNRTEIEEAFDSLLNRASQYANRKY